MASAERLRRLPGYLALNSGVMFFIGLAARLTGETADAAGMAWCVLRARQEIKA
jgi:hypothetical protein